MKRVQSIAGPYEAQFNEILQNALDKREFLTVTTDGVANTEFAVTHERGFVPNGYLVISQDKAGSVYAGTTAWTDSIIYLKASAATIVLKLMVF